MARILGSIDEAIGHTPLLELKRMAKAHGLCARVCAKLECMNPAGSVKDRVAKEMLDDAEARGLLTPDAVIIEPTSGNTGIGLSAVCAARSLRLIIVMPETMSVERRTIMRAYGAELVLTDGSRGMAGAIEKARELQASIPHSFIAGQFENPANPEAHYRTTGPELFADTDGEIDIFVAGVGTGGTITGVGRYLKEKKPSVRVIAVEPATSAVLSGLPAGPHKLQGIGAGFVPQILDTEIYDEVIRVTDADAFSCAREAGKKEGILVGISAGAALYAAMTVAARPENRGKLIAVLLPDTGDRYLSTSLFSE